MRISILTNDGSPLSVTSKTIWGDGAQIGVGGAELGILTLCEEWTKLGYEVTLFNNPREFGVSPFEQRNIDDFNPEEDRDVLIIFRSPNVRAVAAKGLKCWFSTDQYTLPNLSFRDFAPLVDKIVTISEFHSQHFKTAYGIENTIPIDLPVRVDDFDKFDIVKVPNRLIFTSVPDRGLDYLFFAWPLIKREVPDVSLVITSDYRLWGSPSANNEQHRAKWIGQDDVKFLGALPRKRYLEELAQSQILAYPGTYEELFCISAAEAQYAKVYPVTTTTGALSTTNMGRQIGGHPKDPSFNENFANTVVNILKSENLVELQNDVHQKALNRFRPDVILSQWEDKVFS